MSDNTGGEGGGPAVEVKQPGLRFLEAAVYIMVAFWCSCLSG